MCRVRTTKNRSKLIERKIPLAVLTDNDAGLWNGHHIHRRLIIFISPLKRSVFTNYSEFREHLAHNWTFKHRMVFTFTFLGRAPTDCFASICGPLSSDWKPSHTCCVVLWGFKQSLLFVAIEFSFVIVNIFIYNNSFIKSSI